MKRSSLRRYCARCLNAILKLFGEGVEIPKVIIPRSHIAHGFNDELIFLVAKEEDDNPDRRPPGAGDTVSGRPTDPTFRL